jgi:hypothetical protein
LAPQEEKPQESPGDPAAVVDAGSHGSPAPLPGPKPAVATYYAIAALAAVILVALAIIFFRHDREACLVGLPEHVQKRCGCSPASRNVEVALKQTNLPAIAVLKLNECLSGKADINVKDKQVLKSDVQGCLSKDSALDEATKNLLIKVVDNALSGTSDLELRKWQNCYGREVDPTGTVVTTAAGAATSTPIASNPTATSSPCVPKTCSATACGSVPDGCAGTIQCGTCPASCVPATNVWPGLRELVKTQCPSCAGGQFLYSAERGRAWIVSAPQSAWCSCKPSLTGLCTDVAFSNKTGRL